MTNLGSLVNSRTANKIKKKAMEPSAKLKLSVQRKQMSGSLIHRNVLIQHRLHEIRRHTRVLTLWAQVFCSLP